MTELQGRNRDQVLRQRGHIGVPVTIPTITWIMCDQSRAYVVLGRREVIEELQTPAKLGVLVGRRAHV